MSVGATPQRIELSAELRSPIDVTAYLTLWLVLLFGLSARLVVGPFGAIGTPALLVAMGGACWWTASRMIPGLASPARQQPLRVALFLNAWYATASYAVGTTRSLTPLESTGAVRSVLTTLTLTALALLVLDGSSNLHRVEVLMRRVVIAGTVLACYGILQFVTHRSLIVGFPGLTWNNEQWGVGIRSNFARPYGTSLHPIEFSVVLAALFPLAIHFAMTAAPGRPRRRAVTSAILIGLGVPLSISRSGLVVLVVALLVLGATWTWRQRLNAVVITCVAVPVLWLGVPGLVGTLRGMFTNTATDPSIQARLDRVPRVMEHIRERPWFGRGTGTWNIEDYFLIDNEIYVSTIELGLVGMGVLLLLVVTAILTGMWVAHVPGARAQDVGMTRALTAGVAGITVSLATFDAFHYHMLTGVLFLSIGTIGAVYRLACDAHDRP